MTCAHVGNRSNDCSWRHCNQGTEKERTLYDAGHSIARALVQCLSLLSRLLSFNFTEPVVRLHCYALTKGGRLSR